jgi:hypothetical protein
MCVCLCVCIFVNILCKSPRMISEDFYVANIDKLILKYIPNWIKIVCKSSEIKII